MVMSDYEFKSQFSSFSKQRECDLGTPKLVRIGGLEMRWKILLIAVVVVVAAPWIARSTEIEDLAAHALGTGYAGTEVCADCHEDEVADFASTAHGKFDSAEWGHGAETCESCHGPGEAHAEDGDSDLIYSFVSGGSEKTEAACLSCHSGADLTHWQGSLHQTADMACSDCHSMHQDWTADRALVNKNSTDACLSCHTDLKKSLVQRSNHPLKHGQMGCVDCHDPHGSPVQASIDAQSVNDKCWECHAETRGPFLWEHAPVKEDCMTCHKPHGSNQTKLLATSAPRSDTDCGV